ncbi:MAG: glycosyltransferase [Paracoccaceae bacterium]
MRVQALGLCRFSYLGEGGYQVVHDSLDARRGLLYDADRLALRFLWFEKVCLPAWAAQTDPDFKLVVLTGTDFPKPWLDRLRDVTAAVPQIVIELADPGPHREICRAALQHHVDPEADVVGQFRHDDDDAVAVDYVARLRSDFLDKLRPIYAAHPLFSVDYGRGLTLAAIDGEVAVIPQISHNLGVALTLYMPPTHAKCALDYAHHRLANLMPGVCFQDSVMFIRGKHGENDSGGNLRAGYAWNMNMANQSSILRKRFAIDLDDFTRRIEALPKAD